MMTHRVFDCAIVVALVTSLASSFNLEPTEPLVFSEPTPGPNARGSFFGFSVALQHTAGGESWLVVGAPRANSSYYPPNQITEPGAIFKCDLGSKECEELWIDQEGNNENPVQHTGFEYQDLKNNGWLGASLDTQPPTSPRQATAVCAPRWKNQFYSETYLMNGACYWLNASLPNAPANKKLPLIQYDKQTFRVRNRALYYYYYGEAGMAVHFPDDPTEMLVGAPGVFNWQGTVIRFKDSGALPPGNIARRRRRRQITTNEHQMFTQQSVPNPYRVFAIKDFDLMGYSVTSGRFRSTDEILYAAGAPRGSDSLGKVIVFQFLELDGMNVIQEWVGSQMGENFGASMTAADINGDGLSDLVVGAPMFSHGDNWDMGRIQVFLSTATETGGDREGRTSLQPSPIRYSGSARANARFGTTLAACGDLNQDGYQDVAVGAPWEEGGGAVYIYLGSEQGLQQSYSQHLHPQLFSRNLKGFGMAISRGVDIDENGYPDLAIGSFYSGDAVVLKSRTVAVVRGSVSAEPPTIALNATSLLLHACFEYQGHRVPDTTGITAKITLDYSFPTPRASFVDTSTFARIIEVSVPAAEEMCQRFDVKLRDDKIDPRQPILMRMEYELTPDKTKPLLSQPQMDPSGGNTTTGRIGIITGCEIDGDDTCRVDLNVITELSDTGVIVIGGDERPKLTVNIINQGEPVFLPNLTVSVEPPLALLLPVTHSCDFPSAANRTTLVCRLTNPIMSGSEDEVQISVDVSGLDDSAGDASVRVEVQGEGVEVRPDDNTGYQALSVGASASLKLHGYSKEEQILYQRLDADRINTTSMPSFLHSFSLMKEGPTPLGEVEFTVDIPVNFTSGGTFINIYRPQTNFLGQKISCSLRGASYKREEEKDNVEGSFIQQGGTPFITIQPKDEGVVVVPGTDTTSMSSRTSLEKAVDLSCDNPLVSCAQLRCVIQSWPGSTKSAELSVKLGLNLTVLASHMSAKGGAVVKSYGHAEILSLNPLLHFIGQKTAEVVVVTQVQPDSLPGQGIPWWVILLAVLGGLLLLGLLAYGLYKAGFFARKEQDEMKAQRAQLTSNDYGAVNPAMEAD